MNAIWYNLPGILYSAQATGSRFEAGPPPAWPGFDDVWIPVNHQLSLAGRLGLAQRDGRSLRSVCIVLVPGLFGDNWTARSRDLSGALLDAGYHVLSLEQRGHGQTEQRFPDIPYTYGAFETGDLLAVAEWLQQREDVSETGLIGFCWGANEALLTAWEDGRDEEDPHVSPSLQVRLRPRGRPCYRAGVIAFSPPIRFEQVMDRIDRHRSVVIDPVADSLEKIVNSRARQKGYSDVNGSLRRLTQREAKKAAPDDPQFADVGLNYLRLLPRDGTGSDSKMDAARVPVLVVHAVNDPIGSAQDVAELITGTDNPNVAAIVLPDGGHCGFAAYAREYFYSLVVNYFDRDRGAAACARRVIASGTPQHSAAAAVAEADRYD
jgi:predicted alpha/beta-fold hydrolase